MSEDDLWVEIEHPSHELRDYQRFLESRGVPFVTRVLRPSVEAILERQRTRGRPTDRDLEGRRLHAAHQVRCLQSEQIDPEWIIDS